MDIPSMSDDEVAILGEMFAQEGHEAARQFGLDILRRKMWDQLGVTMYRDTGDLPVYPKGFFNDTETPRSRNNPERPSVEQLKRLEKQMEEDLMKEWGDRIAPRKEIDV